MSKTSDIYQGLIDWMVALFPGHYRLTNPYQPEENSVSILEKGIGISFSTNTNSMRSLGPASAFQQQFIVTITRRARANESDITAKTTYEKYLLDDWEAMAAATDGSVIGMPNVVAKTIVQGHNGIQTVFIDMDNFIKIDSIVLIEYFIGLGNC